jgi:next-to-BRCA1 protein 1
MVIDEQDIEVSDAASSNPRPNLRIPKPALRFIKHASFPDGTVVSGGEYFTKTWRVRNDGKKPWPVGVVLISAGGDLMCSEEHQETLPVLEVDEEQDISITLRAPEKSGLYTAYFRAQTNEKQLFGHRLWASIMVES